MKLLQPFKRRSVNYPKISLERIISLRLPRIKESLRFFANLKFRDMFDLIRMGYSLISKKKQGWPVNILGSRARYRSPLSRSQGICCTRHDFPDDKTDLLDGKPVF